MNTFMTDDYTNRIIWALVCVGLVYSIYLAGRIAKRRGRDPKTWALYAGIFIGPLAIPLLFLLPNLHREDPNGPEGEKRPEDVIGAEKPVIQGSPDPSRLNMSLASA